MKIIRRILLLLTIPLVSNNLFGQGWSVNPADYNYTGQVTAVVFHGTTEVTTGTLGAFFGGTCRGYATGTFFPLTGKTVFPVMCYSNQASGEVLTFQYYDPGDGNIYDINETQTFTTEMTAGNDLIPLQYHTRPLLYTVTGGGSYCEGAGGLPVGLTDSETGVTYTLLRDGLSQIPTVAGTGSAISFGNRTGGTYTVTGTNSGGTVTMTGNAVIVENPLPAVPVGSPGSGAACTQITANWSTAANATTYYLDVSTVSDYSVFHPGYQNLNTGNVTSYAVTGLTAGTVYYYRVRSSNSCGTSVSSGSIAYSTSPASPATPGAITGTASQCPALTLQTYSIASVTNATSYTWTVPTGWAITGGQGTTSLTVTTGSFNQNGNITVTASNSCGTSAPSSLAVTVGQGVPATPGIITGTAAQCPALTLQTYSIGSVTNATSYTWTVPTGWAITGGQGTTTLTVTTGSFNQNGNITVTASNSCGTSTARTLGVTVNPGIPAQPGTITGTSAQCPALTLQTYSIGAVTNATSYTWTVPTGWTITGGQGTTTLTVTTGTFNQNGNIAVTASNSCGTSAARSLAVTIGQGVPATPGTITGTAAQCPALTLQTYSIGAVTNATSYTWTVPTGWAITGGQGTTTLTVTTGAFNQNGNITVTASNSCGTSAASSLAVTVNPGTPATPGVITGTSAQCPALTLQTYSIGAVTNATSYTWTVPTGWTITGGQGTTTLTVTTGAFNQNGNITVTASNSCGTSAASSLAVTVNPGTPATPGVITGTAAQCPALTLQTYSIGAVTNATSYTWTVPTGWTITGGQGTTTLTVTTGAYNQNGNIAVTAGNSCGTSTARTLAVIVNPGAPSQPGVITGTAAQCPALTLQTYSIASVTNATSYTWTVPTGWTITGGQGTTTLTVTTGAFNQNGNIAVTAGNSCGMSTARTLAVTVNPGTPSQPGVITGTAAQCPALTLQTYSIGSVTNATSYTWTVPTGWTITGGQGTTTLTVTTGAFNQNGNITVTASNSCGTSIARTLAVSVNPGAPAQPGVITGTSAQCPGVTLQTYSIVSVTNATTYTWTVPAGWTITAGQGTISATVTSGSAGQNGNITITAGNSCGTSTARSLAVTVDAIPSSPVLSITQTTCSASTGTITILSPAGTGMTYSINGSTYTNTTGIFSGVVAGTYNVTARSQAGCTSSGIPATINIQPVTPTAPTVGTITVPTCNLSTGSVVLSGLPSTGTWTLIRSPGGTTTSGSGNSTLISALPSGETYTFTVTNTQGCTSVGSSAVVIPSQPITPTAPIIGIITSPTCALSTGSVALSGLPSTGTWSLTRYPGTISTPGSGANTVLSGLPEGTYNYTVTTEAGCTSLLSSNVIIPDQPVTPAIPVTGSIVQPTCSVSTGSVTLSGLPATGTWTITKSPGGTTTTGSGTSRIISGLSSGTHTFTVTNDELCTSGSSANVVINAQPVTPSAPVPGTVTHPTCILATGSVALSGLPITGTWTLTRLPGSVTTSGTGTSTTVSGIEQGSYNYTVTSSSGCTSVASSAVVINAQPASPAIPTQTFDCALGFGNASVTILSPVGGGLEYRLNSGTYQTATTFTGVANGNYTITVRNLSGCTTTGNTFNINCGCVNPPTLTPGNLNGSVCGTTPITVTGNTFGGSATSVAITENGTGTVSPTTVTSSPFSFTYTPGIGDAGNTVTITLTTNNPLGSPCASATATYLLTVNIRPTVPSVGTISHPTCLITTGSVLLSGLPTTGTWTITRSPGGETVSGTGTSTSVSGLPTGTHTFTVTNSNGCTSVTTSNVVINSQPVIPAAPLIGTITQPTCISPTGSVILNGLPSSGTWTLTRSPGGIVTSGTGSSTTITGLNTGTYNYTVSNSVGCISSLSQGIVIASQPVTPTSPAIGSIVHPTCSEPTGSVTLLGLPDAGIWTLVRTPGGNTTTGAGTSTIITGLASGTYSYRITNSAGCSSLSSGNIIINSQPPTPSAPVAGTITQPTCNVSTGSVVLGGLPSSGSWIITTLPGSLITTGTGTSKAVSGLITGTYNFTVTNSFGCISVPSADVLINVQPTIPSAPLLGNITQPSCNLSTGSVLLTGLPASGPWTLTRFPGSVNTAGSGTSFTVNDLVTGTYNFTVTNSAGCISAASANLVVNSQPPTPSIPTVGSITQTTCTITTGSVIIGGLPASGTWNLSSNPATTIFSGSGTTTLVTELIPDTYTFMVTNSFGCISLPTTQVIINQQPATTPSLIITDPAPLCYPAVTDLTQASVTAGSSPGLDYTYWTNESATNPLAEPEAAVKGIYYIKATSALGCYTVKPVTVEVLQKPMANAGEDKILEYLFETKLEGSLLLTGETGLWTIVSGSGKFSDPEDPETRVHDLVLGENKLQWTITNGVCSPESDIMTITVHNLVIPTLITPNMDGKNDYFVLMGIETLGKTELIIFDRRGLQVYKNTEYDNSWNGVDQNDAPLQDDTYFFTIKAQNGKSLSGYILIRR